MEKNKPLVVCSGLTKSYGSFTALKNLDLNLERGRFIGLLGPNGSGKTTTIKLLNGLLQPTSGMITVDGAQPGCYTHSIVSYLPDRAYLSDWMKVTDVIDFFSDFYRDFDRVKAIEMFKALRISPLDRLKTLSKGTKEKVQLILTMSRRAQLYVLDEPSIGLHPSNIVGLTGVMHDLVADGNSVILVDHDTQILKEADWIVEMGPEAGAKGGHVIAEGNIPMIEENPNSQIGPFLSGKAETKLRERAKKDELFANGTVHLSTSQIHTVKPLEVDIPRGRFTVVTGVSGSGKTTMVLESLVPALEAKINGNPLPAHIRSVEADGIAHVKLIDATPVGINVRSTVATYAGVHDELRKLYAKSPDAKEHGYKASDFSYNTGSLRCPGCDGTGVVSLDVQFLPDVNIPCPDCRGSRYARAAYGVKLMNKAGENASLPELMDMDVNSAIEFCANRKTVSQKLGILKQLGLGYLTLGEETPSLSGGEAQRLKLASEIGRTQTDSVFVFDEPSIGLHPLDVRVLLGVFQALLDNGATVVVIEHDLDVIRNADFLIDMGPGGGEAGGRIVASGTPEEIQLNPDSITGQYL